MGNRYRQLCLAERIEIYRLHSAGESLRMIASFVGRSASTISRELKRNSKPTKAWPGGYLPDRANRLAERRRRWDCRYKLARQPGLRALVYDRLAMGWSPEQIAGRLTQQNAPTRISHESIYRFIYHRSAQKDYWHRLLPKRKSRRGKLGKRGGSAINRIKHRRSLHDRPLEANNRQTAGHWEADLMLFSKYGQAVLVAHERHSRLLMLSRQPSKHAQPTIDRLKQMLMAFPPSWRKTMTFDNGTEFAFHHQLNTSIGVQTFFCDPHAPWQKGGVENAISRMRRMLPRKTDIGKITQGKIDLMVIKYNNTPRKCLAFKTPVEVMSEQLQPLHFKRDSTFPLSRE